MLTMYTISEYAINKHKTTNHQYDGNPYAVHLEMVYDEARKYSENMSDEDRFNFIAAAWCHDLIEDCRETYNDIKKNTNEAIAELVYAVTNEKGKTRKERANKKYYEDMKKVPNACLLKICDRIANVKYSKQQGSDMFLKYSNENASFILSVNNKECDEAIADLCSLFRNS